MILHPSIVAAFKVYNILEEYLLQHPAGIFAAPAATAVESNGALGVERSGKFLMPFHHINIYTAWQVSRSIFLGSAHIDKLHRTIGDERLELLYIESLETATDGVDTHARLQGKQRRCLALQKRNL